MLHRFSRTEKIIGKKGLESLARARVAVFGLGGVGSYTVEALARSGVGSFLLVDPDKVDITNINRQLHALSGTVGSAKVTLMAERIKEINPEANVEVRQERLTRLNSGEFLQDNLSFVVDAIDDLDNKVHLLKRCVEKNIPVVSAMGMGNKVDPTALKVMDISKTSVCPLARIVRRELRRENIHAGITVVCSSEHPVKPRPEYVEKGANAPGSMAFVPPVAGMILAGVVTNSVVNRIP